MAAFRSFALFLCLLLVAGCATPVADRPSSDAGAGREAGKGVAFQRKSLTPVDGGRLARSEDLQPGDILLSSAPGPTPYGIRLLTMSPVSKAALYVGNGEVAEAFDGSLRLRRIDVVLAEEPVVVAFRHPALDGADSEIVRRYALDKLGRSHDEVGIMMHGSFALQRRECETPGVAPLLRETCRSTLATLQLIHGDDDRFFCPQFVLESYRAVGLPLTRATPSWVSQEDIAPIGDGDLASVPVEQPLLYVGHLKLPTLGAPAPPVR
jgi:hypothetical protein